MCLWPGYHLHHDTAKHGYSGVVRVKWRVEWRSVVFIDESRFCLYASDGRTRVRRKPGGCHPPECIRPQRTGPTSGFMVWGDISYNWGYVKNLVNQIKINSLQHLQNRIRDAFVMVAPNMFQATWNEVEYRLDICRATKGAHIRLNKDIMRY